MSDEQNPTLHAQKISAKSRTYFFDVKTSRNGNQYLCITETRAMGDDHERHRVMIFQEQMASFHNAYLKAAEQFQLKSTTRSQTSSSRLDRIRKNYANAYKKWTPEENQALRSSFQQGTEIDELAKLLQRQPSAIRSRLSKLGLDPIAS